MTKYATTAELRIHYREIGDSYVSWLRSLYASTAVYFVNSIGGGLSYTGSNAAYGLAPGFCLPGPTVEGGIEEYNVSYAVAIYGINADTYLDENNDEQTAGLTFGPATGADYRSSYRSHVDTDADGIDDDDIAALSGKTLITSDNFLTMTKTYADEHGYVYCIHWLTWEQIVEQCAVDPEVFEDCLTCGCTHSVQLNLSYTIWSGTNYYGMTGDGASLLFNSIYSDYRKWNASGKTDGGWSSSQAWSVLNDPDYGMITGFPTVLQNNIVGKMISYPESYTSPCSLENWTTTYDKLWLFSFQEFFGTITSTTDCRYYEGTQYLRMTEYASAATLRIHYYENGSTTNSWLRSMTGTQTVSTVGTNGRGGYGGANALCGYAPGFCLP